MTKFTMKRKGDGQWSQYCMKSQTENYLDTN